MSLDVPWSIKPHRFEEYLQTIADLRERYKEQLPIYIGLEIDYIPNVTSPTRADFAMLDYNIGSVHYGHQHPEEGWYWEIDGTQQAYDKGIAEIYGGDIKKAVGSYFALQQEMLQTAPPQVLGHMDKVKMNNQKPLLYRRRTLVKAKFVPYLGYRSPSRRVDRGEYARCLQEKNHLPLPFSFCFRTHQRTEHSHSSQLRCSPPSRNYRLLYRSRPYVAKHRFQRAKHTHSARMATPSFFGKRDRVLKSCKTSRFLTFFNFRFTGIYPVFGECSARFYTSQPSLKQVSQ